ncbi:MAG: hypothetical protein Q7J25_10335 [Vicinamibacterales bacterium]|nr:hypothetical protein [Vicinamibacterales bacterium]
MGLLFPEGRSQNRQAPGTFAQQTQTGGKGHTVERRNRRLVGLNTRPICGDLVGPLL